MSDTASDSSDPSQENHTETAQDSTTSSDALHDSIQNSMTVAAENEAIEVKVDDSENPQTVEVDSHDAHVIVDGEVKIQDIEYRERRLEGKIKVFVT